MTETHEPTEPETPEPTPWLKLHPLTPVIDGGLALVIIVGIIIANMRDVIINTFVGDRWSSDFEEWEGEEEEWSFNEFLFADNNLIIAILIVLGIILLGLGIAWVSWYFHSYQINDDAVEMKKGVFVKKHRRAPLERIQSVNLQRPLIARLFGLTKIDVQTGGSGGAVSLAYLANAQAKIVRQQILRTASEATQTPSETPDESVSHGNGDGDASSDGHKSAGVAGEFDRRAQEFVDFDIEEHENAHESVVKVPHGRLIGSIALSHEAVFVYLAVIAVPIFGATISWAFLAGLIPAVIALAGLLIGRFNRGFNYSISSTSNGIRTGSGLTSTSTDTIPRHRIHAIDIAQPIWWRPFGWWRIRLVTAGSGSLSSSSSQGNLENVVLPVGKREDVLRVLEVISPQFEPEGEQHWLLDALEGPGTGFTPAGPKAAWVLWFGRKRAGISIAHGDSQDAMVRIRRGAMTRHLVLMPVVRTQSIMLHRSFVHRVLGLASLTMHTVPGPAMVMVRGVALSEAKAWWNYLTVTTIRVQHGDQKPMLDE